MTGVLVGNGSLISAVSPLTPALGGTGVANGSNNTITFTGNYTLGITLTNNTSITFPTSGTLATNPMTTLGDVTYGGASGVVTRLAGDTSNTRKFLRELSVAGVAAAPVWDTILAADIPTLNQNTTGSSGSCTGNSATATTASGVSAGVVAGKMIYDAFTATASQTTFTTSTTYTSGKIEVFCNGVKMNGGDVTVTSGTSVVFATGLAVNSIVNLVYPI